MRGHGRDKPSRWSGRLEPHKGQLVLVEWRDAYSSGGWTDLKDHPKDARCSTVGWVVRKTDKFLTVAAHRWEGKQHPGPDVGDPISIPWAIVLGWKSLTEGGGFWSK